MSYPFEPTTTKELKVFLKEYLEESCKNPETNQGNKQSSHLKNRNKLVILSRILNTWGERRINS